MSSSTSDSTALFDLHAGVLRRAYLAVMALYEPNLPECTCPCDLREEHIAWAENEVRTCLRGTWAGTFMHVYSQQGCIAVMALQDTGNSGYVNWDLLQTCIMHGLSSG